MPLPRKTLPLLILSVLLVAYWHFSPDLSLLPRGTTQTPPSSSSSTMGSAPRPLRLAVLELDTPFPKTNAKYGGYTGIFTSVLSAAAKTLSPPRELSELASVTSHDVVHDFNSYPKLEEVDALLLTGSRYNAYDDDEWIRKLVAFTKEAIDSGRVKLLGICFGHQIIGRALGAKVGKNEKGWEIAVSDVDLTDQGKQLLQLDNMRIQQMHSDIVYGFPDNVQSLGSNSQCANQGMYLPGRFITVQGHPEFTGDIITEILAGRHEIGVFPDDVYEDAMKRATIPHDGVAIGKAFLKFLLEG